MALGAHQAPDELAQPLVPEPPELLLLAEIRS
jgi:hypothetical protein